MRFFSISERYSFGLLRLLLMGLLLLPHGSFAQQPAIAVGAEDSAPKPKQESSSEAFSKIEGIEHVLRVTQVASEVNPKEHIFGELTSALELAMTYLRQGQSTMIVLDSGAYREKLPPLVLPEEERSGAMLVLRAAIPYMTYLRGSDVWESDTWKYDMEGRVYYRKWPFERVSDHSPIEGQPWPLRQRALIFMDGVRLREHPLPRGIPAGNYHLHEDGHVYLVPPEGMRVVDWDKVASIEVGNYERAPLLETKGINLVLQGIGFDHSPGRFFEDAAVEITDAQRVILQRCQFSWNGGTGLRIQNVDTLSLHQVTCDHNGRRGLELLDVDELESRGVRVGLNFWRGIESGYDTDFFPEEAAWVMRGVGQAMIGQPVIVENRSHGLFADGGSGRWEMTGGFVAANNGMGMTTDFMRDFDVSDVRVVYNNGGGMDVLGNVSIRECILYHNGLPEVYRAPIAQLAVPGTVGQYRIANSILESDLPEVPIIRVSKGEGAFPQFQSRGNLYHSPAAEDAFSVYGYAMDMATWRVFTRSDERSLFTDPKIVEPSEAADLPDPYLFTFELDSPVFFRDQWPQDELPAPAVTESLRARLLQAP